VDIIEQSITPKTGDADLCEDGIVVTDGFAAVVDGATDKSGLRYGGGSDKVTGGRHAMLVVAKTIAALDPIIEPLAAVAELVHALAETLPDGLAAGDRPAAVTTVYSAARREIWQIGDVGFWYRGLPETQPHKDVDALSAMMRSAVLTAELLDGASPEQLARAADDVGRAAILPLLTRQGVFANNLAAGRFAYAAIDGRPIPEQLITIVSVPVGITEIVLASDGYPVLAPTLADAESALKRLVAEDPLCIGPLVGTKGIRPGSTGFDDRSYLRIAI
jgi:hypothetical protein